MMGSGPRPRRYAPHQHAVCSPAVQRVTYAGTDFGASALHAVLLG